MNQDQLKRLEELRRFQERKSKQGLLEAKLNGLFPTSAYTMMPYEDSEDIQQKLNEWPNGKWENYLYIQTPVENKGPIENLVKRFIEINQKETTYLLFMNYNFGLVEVKNEMLVNHWPELIDLDGDEIFCHIPERPEFICIEKTEEVISGKEHEGRRWIYEVTFSSEAFKVELQTNGT
jgi:hypothetical protein